MRLNKLKDWRIVLSGLAALALVGVAALAFIRLPASTAEQRGHKLARDLGCFACHGPGATGGIPNPGPNDEEIPAWDGGMAMMYIENEQEIREWILYGAPRRTQKESRESGGQEHHHEHGKTGPQEEEAEAEPGDLILMPGYEGRISESDLQDLIAYYKAVAAYDTPSSEKAKQGQDIAGRLGCFGCHGPGGLLGASNPGSFKGYIPPWKGSDFDELVRNDEELRQWILEGKIKRFESNPLARFFTRRQIIQMPAYGNRLKEGELEALITYVKGVRKK